MSAVEDVDLFGEPITPPTPPKAQDAPKDEAEGGQKPRWSKRTGGRYEKCDQCVSQMVAGGAWHAPNAATHQRTQGQHVLLLCYQHTQEQRVMDGLDPFKR